MPKPIISLIAAIDSQFGLGKNNQLLCHLPADLQHFKHHTMGKPIVMGRKTLESLGRALPGRRNIVLTSGSIGLPDIEQASSLPEALSLCEDAPEVMIIGGAQVYTQFLPLADYLLITHIKATFQADVFFPPWESAQWQRMNSRAFAADEKHPHAFDIVLYQRIAGSLDETASSP
ncbi:MAG: dihydrofolate reductase [Legionellaceae bacterium]|nr:dihydrofolate reductase [Legionellaceae bacterium]